MTSRHFSSMLLLASGVAAAAQSATPLVLKEGTGITIQNTSDFIPKKAKVGDAVDFATSFPVRSGSVAVLPRRAILHGHVTALTPKVQITLDPVEVSGTTVTFRGYPFEVKGAKHDEQPVSMPPELAWHANTTAGEKAATVGEVAAAAPLIVAATAIAVPVALVMMPFMYHPGHVYAGTRSLVTIAADTSFEPVALPSPEIYSGLPIIYIVDRFRTADNAVLCGSEQIFANAYGTNITVRVAPETYVFKASDNAQTTALVEARQDGRYLVFRDKDGLHSVDLATRPDLLFAGLPAPAKAQFFFDESTVQASQRETIDLDRSRGGCGIQRLLHTRPLTQREAVPAP